VGGSIDFNDVSEAKIKQFLEGIKFDEPPESKLVVKKGLLKRDGGAFSNFKDCTALLTKDK